MNAQIIEANIAEITETELALPEFNPVQPDAAEDFIQPDAPEGDPVVDPQAFVNHLFAR